MKRVVIITTSLIVVASAAYATGTAWGAGSAPTYVAPTVLAQAGSIHGFVYCGGGEGEGMAMEGMGGPKARPWSTVWVAGHSFSARTDENGEFSIDYVPPGTYRLGVQTAGMPIRLQYPAIPEVTVLPRAITDVGVLTVTGGCGQCGSGSGGSGGCGGEEGGGCEGGGEGGDTGGCGGDTGGCGG